MINGLTCQVLNSLFSQGKIVFAQRFAHLLLGGVEKKTKEDWAILLTVLIDPSGVWRFVSPQGNNIDRGVIQASIPFH